jgi:hypothetical protein
MTMTMTMMTKTATTMMMMMTMTTAPEYLSRHDRRSLLRILAALE